MTFEDAHSASGASKRSYRRPIRSLLQAARDTRFALGAFVGVEIAALPLLVVLGRGRWFHKDDWIFLSERMELNIETLFSNQYNHWMTLPILVYRALWSLVGARYGAYQLLVIVLHLVAVALLRSVMRRAGVGPWIANVAAVMLLFFGFGAENIFVAINMMFVGAFVFGLTQLLLADHDGGIDQRDWLGLLAGLAALMCSNAAIAMIAVVGIAALWRRGWQVALFHTVPLAAIYAGWWFVLSNSGGGNPFGASIGEVVRFVAIGIGAAFRGLGYFWVIGIGLGAMLVAGLASAVAGRERGELKRYVAPTALLLGALLFLIVTGLKRANPAVGPGPVSARYSRYIYVTGAMTLPALAVAADALVRRWRRLGAVVLVLLVVGLPGNFHRLDSYMSGFPWRQYRRDILVLARAPLADQVPPSTPSPIEGNWHLTIGWLTRSARSGQFPRPTNVKPDELATATMAVALAAAYPTSGACRSLQSTAIFVLHAGQTLSVLKGAISVRYASPDGGVSRPRSLIAPAAVRALAGPLNLSVIPREPATVACV